MKCSLPELVGTRQTNPKCSKEERELKSRSRVRFSWSQAIPLASPTRELRPIRQYQLKVDGQSHIKGNERKVNEDAWRQVKEDESVSRCRKDRTPKATAGHLKPFRNALRPCRSFADVVAAHPECHLISFRFLSALLLQVVRGLPIFF